MVMLWEFLSLAAELLVYYWALRWLFQKDYLYELRRLHAGRIQVWMYNGQHIITFGEHQVSDTTLRRALKKAVKNDGK